MKEVDLGREIDNISEKYRGLESLCEHDVIEICEHFFKFGANWQKEQLMTEAKSGIGNNDNYIQFEDGTWIDLDPSMQLKPAFDIKEGEKLKVLVIKKE